jgi:hypothetical protein
MFAAIGDKVLDNGDMAQGFLKGNRDAKKSAPSITGATCGIAAGTKKLLSNAILFPFAVAHDLLTLPAATVGFVARAIGTKADFVRRGVHRLFSPAQKLLGDKRDTSLATAS